MTTERSSTVSAAVVRVLAIVMSRFTTRRDMQTRSVDGCEHVDDVDQRGPCRGARTVAVPDQRGHHRTVHRAHQGGEQFGAYRPPRAFDDLDDGIGALPKAAPLDVAQPGLPRAGDDALIP